MMLHGYIVDAKRPDEDTSQVRMFDSETEATRYYDELNEDQYDFVQLIQCNGAKPSIYLQGKCREECDVPSRSTKMPNL